MTIVETLRRDFKEGQAIVVARYVHLRRRLGVRRIAREMGWTLEEAQRWVDLGRRIYG